MDPELTALAASGATVLVQRMVGDGWEQVRDRLARFFSRARGGAEEAVRAQLETAREELIAARDTEDDEAESDVCAEWRNHLRRALRTDPGLAAELRSLVDELTSRDRRDQGVHTYNTISGGVQHGTVIQAGKVGSVYLGSSTRPPSG